MSPSTWRRATTPRRSAAADRTNHKIGATTKEETMKPRHHRPAERLRDDDATKVCPVCQHRFQVVGRGQYCSDGCRKKAWRLRHQSAAAPVVVPAPGVSRRSLTVYTCQTCDTKALGVQRCEDCGAF